MAEGAPPSVPTAGVPGAAVPAVPAVPAGPSRPARAFDPATGDWLLPASQPVWDPEAPRRGVAAMVWHIVLGIDLVLLAFLLVAAVYTYFVPREGLPQLDAQILVLNSIVNFVLLGLIPFLWVVGTRQGGLHGAIHYLRLERPAYAIPRGILWGFALVLAVFLVLYGITEAGVELENPQVAAMGSVMTLPLALLMALTAGVGEEILFRGVLQRWIGVWPQAVLFGLLHADYGVPAQIIVPFLMGLLFGYLVKRGARLWVPIAAHVTFDLIMLGGAALLN